MHSKDLFFVIPTYRLREVAETVEHYDEHFWRNGHSVRMLVFDDGSQANQEKYYSLLEQLLLDTAMDLETNASKGLSRENSLVLRRGQLAGDAVVKMAQTFRSGTNDIDAIDYVELFLADHEQINPDDLNDLYVLVNFRPAVTKKNWRMDYGVAGYDKQAGCLGSSTWSARLSHVSDQRLEHVFEGDDAERLPVSRVAHDPHLRAVLLVLGANRH